MKEFMMLFRDTPNPQPTAPSQEAIEGEMKKWNDWIGGIAAQGKFVDAKQLSYDGKILNQDNVITDGPYAEVKEILGGYTIVKAENYEEALEMAKGCPIFDSNGHVEIREFINTDG